MKKIILAISLLSAGAFANPFDSFAGEYKAVSAPVIRPQGSSKCIWFNFDKIIGFVLRQDTDGYNQSHLYKILRSDGWSANPISEFSWVIESKTGGSSAKTTGSTDTATNEYVSYGADTREVFTLSLRRNGNQTTLTAEDNRYSKSVLTFGCFYSVDLQLK